MLFWIGFGIATSLMFSSPAAAQSRQVGIDIPVQWVADIDGSMTLETFLALPESALTTGQRIPSFGYSAKTYWFKSHLPAADFDGEPRWLQLGPSFIDHLSVFYRPAGSNLPWTHKEFGDHASTRDSDLDYRESVLILAPPPDDAGYDMVFRLRSSSTLILLATLSSPRSLSALQPGIPHSGAFILAWRRLPAELPCGLPYCYVAACCGEFACFPSTIRWWRRYTATRSGFLAMPFSPCRMR